MFDTYSVEYRCDNCGHSFTVQFIKGVRATPTATCRHCKCSGATKCGTPWRKTPFNPRDMRWSSDIDMRIRQAIPKSRRDGLYMGASPPSS